MLQYVCGPPRALFNTFYPFYKLQILYELNAHYFHNVTLLTINYYDLNNITYSI